MIATKRCLLRCVEVMSNFSEDCDNLAISTQAKSQVEVMSNFSEDCDFFSCTNIVINCVEVMSNFSEDCDNEETFS